MLSIGRALVARPRALLLDEPSLGLAPLLVAQIMALVRRLADTLELAVLLVEQNARSALSISERGRRAQPRSGGRRRQGGRACRRRAAPPRLPRVSERTMTKFIDLTLNGISTGAIYAAVALALVLIWRATRIVNFAQGAMLMITTFIASAVINSTGSYVLGLRGRAAVGLRARRGRRAGADPAGRGRPAAERGDRHARPVHAAGRGRRDDLGQHAALVPGRVLDPRLRGRRHAAAVRAQRHVHRGGRDRRRARARAAVPGDRRSACRCARRRSRPRSRGCSACASGGCSRSAGRWPRSPARSPGCWSRRRCSSAPTTSIRS